MKLVWQLLAGRVVPVLFFGWAAAGAALRATVVQGFAERGGLAPLVLVRELGELFFFATAVVAYASRGPRKGARRGPLVALVSFGAVGALVAATMRPYRAVTTVDWVGIALVAVGFLGSFVALVYARRSFSILPDARELVTGGPYALCRHPIYLGQTVAMLGALLPMSAPWLLGIAPFAAAQFLRARWEESLLASEVPEWNAYASRVPRYVPFLR